MLIWHILAAAMLAGPAQPSPYRPPANLPDPAAQRDEMIALYDEICLRAFPDDKAAGDAVARHGATPLTDAQVRVLLHEDPGIGWAVDGRTGRFNVTIEAPPFHACAVRTMTAAGFPDFGPYRAEIEALGIDASQIVQRDDHLTASAFMMADMKSNQIASFYPGPAEFAQQIDAKALGDRVPYALLGATGPETMRKHTRELGAASCRLILKNSTTVRLAWG